MIGKKGIENWGIHFLPEPTIFFPPKGEKMRVLMAWDSPIKFPF